MPTEFGKLKVVSDFRGNCFYKKSGSQKMDRNELYGCAGERAEIMGKLKNY